MKFKPLPIIIVSCFLISSVCAVLAYRESQRTKEYISQYHQAVADADDGHVYEHGGVSLVKAIIEVESGGRVGAIGEAGELGILQIRPIMVDEVNRITGKGFRLSDRRDPDKSLEMFWDYTTHWNAVKGDDSYEGMARRWNGGPTGHTKPSTLPYWEKVKAAMEDMQ